MERKVVLALTRLPLSAYAAGAAGLLLAAALYDTLWGPDTAPAVAAAGLDNITGADCYMNATLQALAALDSFVFALQQRVASRPPGASPLSAALLRLLVLLARPGGLPRGDGNVARGDVNVARAAVEARLGARGLVAGEQQDAHEFLHVLLAAVDAELAALSPAAAATIGLAALAVPRAPPPPAMSPLQGLVAAVRRCLVCGHTNPLHLEAFSVLSVPPARSLSAAFAALAAPDVVSDVACDACAVLAALRRTPPQTSPASCARLLRQLPGDVRRRVLDENPALAAVLIAALASPLDGPPSLPLPPLPLPTVRSRCVRVTTVARLPPVLCVHVNRLIAPGAKLAHHVRFPELLPAAAVCPGFDAVTQSSSADADAADDVYRLAAVLVHRGGAAGGHFVTLRRAPPSPPLSGTGTASTDAASAWLLISDDAVHGLSWDAVAAAEPYMLFYERVAPL